MNPIVPKAVPSQALLEIQNIVVAYGRIEVLHGISLLVNNGEVVSVIGANGAGKTSLLKCLSGLHPCSAGEIIFRGSACTAASAPQRVAAGIALVPEGRKIFPRLSVLENLELGGYLRRNREDLERDIEEAFILFPILKERCRQAGGTLSGGEQQMLAIARALMSSPKLLLMDEPSMGVAPLLVAKIFETIQELNEQGMTILLVEQNARLALKYSRRAYVIETGSIIHQGASQDLLHDPRVEEAYLGGP